MTPSGITRLQLDEGYVLYLYDDSTGLPVGQLPSGGWPTIGYGRNLATDPLVPVEAAFLFNSSLATIEAYMKVTYPWLTFGNIPADVLTMVEYNTGKLAEFVKMLAAARRNDLPAMAAELMNSAAARGLPARYGRMRTALLVGSWTLDVA